METRVFFGNIREQLLLKRQSLSAWLQTTPPDKRSVQLGPVREPEVLACLHDLDSAIAKAADGALGICKVCHDYVNGRLLMMDYTACVCLDHYSTEERRQLEWELEMSQVVQRALLPQAVPDIDGLELAAFSRPAQIVGGDYFDFFQYRDGAHGVAIADVAGHGVSASLLMASVQTALRTLAPLTDDPAEIIGHLNRFFCRNVHFTTFVTLFLGRFETASRAFTYVNAGHNPPLIARGKPNGEAQSWLRPTAAAIGLVEEASYRTGSAVLVAGDVLMLYTDGVTEAANAAGEEFGAARLAELVTGQARLPAQDLASNVYRALVEFTGNHQLVDDATLIACKIG
jgi:sigma-B regulation protein RsbU (phosphoserine phosphatase)